MHTGTEEILSMGAPTPLPASPPLLSVIWPEWRLYWAAGQHRGTTSCWPRKLYSCCHHGHADQAPQKDIPTLPNFVLSSTARFGTQLPSKRPLSGPATGHHRRPVSHVPRRPEAHVCDLAHEVAVVGVNPVGKLSEVGDNPVVAAIDLPERSGGVHGHGGAASKHRQAKTALRLLLVVDLVPVRRHPILNVGRGMTRAQDAVLEGQVLQSERLEERVLRC
mmetsp:Transcript_33979/g.68588  ORF Transcript_33979/g.68588 Transcript_33979/m.68588 type:complete len:220 (-) Transcript_33979:30-689(-)